MSEKVPQILIVEDEAVVAMDIRASLERSGYTVVGTAASGEDAWAAARDRLPELVLMDVHLRGRTDGIEVARRILDELDIPIIYLTAFADDQTLERAKATGPYGYLVKPFDERDLRASIEVALRKHSLQRKLARSREDMRALLDALRHGVVLIDRKGMTSFLNQAGRQMLGCDEETAVGRLWRDLLPPTVATKLERRIGEVVRFEGQRSTGEPISLEAERLADPRNQERSIVLLHDVTRESELLRQLEGKSRFEDLLGQSKQMRRVFQLIEDVAGVDTSVLLRGETGTGKELVARAVHRRSERCDGPFVAVNCGGLSDDLAGSLLFGHRKGAFTGAVSHHDGYFEAASAGTLFLDEIGELSPRIQGVLLRVLEEHEVHRVGETTPRALDVRVIAATNRRLEEEMEQGGFRSDLFFRLRGAEIQLPPLAARREDIPLLAQSFLAEACAASGKSIEGLSDEALAQVLSYEWPGNVRELKNAIGFAVLRARGTHLHVDDLPAELAVAEPADQDEPGVIRAALEQAGGNRKKAARILGISRATFYRRLKRHGIEKAE